MDNDCICQWLFLLFSFLLLGFGFGDVCACFRDSEVLLVLRRQGLGIPHFLQHAGQRMVHPGMSVVPAWEVLQGRKQKQLVQAELVRTWRMTEASQDVLPM